MKANPIYLDNSATTKPYDEVVDTFVKVSTAYFGNPSSLHTLGMHAEKLIVESRERMAQLLGVKTNELLFTASGSEGNNLAIKGAAYARKDRGNHLITTEVEHASVEEPCLQLEREGYEVTYLPVDRLGRINVNELQSAIRPTTILVSLGHVNSEVGVIQPIEEVGQLLRDYPQIYFHVDHVQGLSKVPLSFKEANIDLCTGSAHKFHGLKGTGFLYVREGVQLQPLVQGGGQEHGLRAGTENVAGIVAMTKALRLAVEKKDALLESLIKMKEQLILQLGNIDGIVLNSPTEHAAPHIVNFSIPYVKPEVVIQSLAAKQIYVSTRSACSSKLSEPSRILTAMGLGKERAMSGIRISLSYETTEKELQVLVQELTELIPELVKVVSK